MRSKLWWATIAILALVGVPAVAQDEVYVDFESPTYSVGAIDGQDGWTIVDQDGGDALVVDTENGPSDSGTQCVELNVLNGTEDHALINIAKFFDDLVISGGPLITFKYDIKWYVDDPTDNGVLMWHRIPGSRTAHWWSLYCQRTGTREPTGTDEEWTPGGPSVEYDGDWHTVTWTFVYGDMGDGQIGQLYSVQLDDKYVMKYHNYTPWDGIVPAVDYVVLDLADGYWPAWSFDDRCYIDNLLIRGEPLPSAVPVADAGPDVVQNPGSWDGVQLQGGATDDGEIVRYRWTIGYGWDAPLVYDGTEATPTVDLGPGVYDLVLTVFDDTGLRDTDVATYTIGDRPAIADEVAGPWGIRNADISGTGASDQIPIDTSSGEFEVVSTTYVEGPWDGLPSEDDNLVFDRFGNFYFLSWNELLESYDANGNKRWRGHDDSGQEKVLGGDIGAHPLIAGVRYIYVVGGQRDDHPEEPMVYAFEKSTGQLVWETSLPNEDWAGQPARPKVTLYNDKLYIVGETVDSYVNIHQVDATTGHHDWVSSCLVELQYLSDNNRGSAAFVPDAFGAGMHGLFWNQMSDWWDWAGSDGFADIAAIRVDPATGATSMWGPDENIDGPGLETSHPIYSATTGKIYTPSYKDYWTASYYAWDPVTGLYGTRAGDDCGDHGYRDNFVLDFDGTTVHAPAAFDAIYSYIDNGDGTFSVEYRDFGGYLQHGWGFAAPGCLLKDQNGHSIFITATQEYNENPDYVPTKVVAVDLSEPAGSDLTPIAEWVGGEWDAANQRWSWYMPFAGPTPGPDGSIYIIQNDWDWWYEQTRIVRLRFVPGAECVGDIDGNGVTGHSDLGILLADWGCSGGDCVGDIDGNGVTGHSDLGILLADWGCGT